MNCPLTTTGWDKYINQTSTPKGEQWKRKTYPEFGTFDWIISIDTSEEEYIYSAKDIKFLNYSKSIKEAEEKIKIINEKIADVKKNLDEIEEISNELE